MEGKTRPILGNLLITLISVALLGSAAAKLAHVPAVVAQMSANGVAGDQLTFVAVLEILSAVTLLIPATRSIGLLLISSFLGGAIATHFEHGQSIVPPSLVLIFAWLGTWLRHPFILWSLLSQPVQGTAARASEGAGFVRPA